MLEAGPPPPQDYRFGEDTQGSPQRAPAFPDHNELVARYAYAGIEVSELLTPMLETTLQRACDQLSVDRSRVAMFVQHQSEGQASCAPTSGDRCVLLVTSGLVNLLDSDELCFVVGHELGHYVYRHADPLPARESSGEVMQLQRAWEISADRCGLVSCGKLDFAMTAMMKVASGLDGAHLRFDIRQFVASAKAFEGKGHITRGVTHPALAVRARALIWFHSHLTAGAKREELEKIDARVRRELEKFVDGGLREDRQARRTELTKWKVAELIHHEPGIQDGWDKVVAREIGAEGAEEIRAFLDDKDFEGVAADLQLRVKAMLDEIRQQFSQSAPQIEDEALSAAYKLLETLKAR